MKLFCVTNNKALSTRHLKIESAAMINASFEDRKCCNHRQAQRVFVPLD